MRRLWFLALLFAFSCASTLRAQTPINVATASNHLQWEILGETVAAAQAKAYRIYIDAAPGVPYTGVTCVPSVVTPGAATCTAPIPTGLSDGTHLVSLTQTGSGVESDKSTPLSFPFVLLVTPTNVRIVTVTN